MKYSPVVIILLILGVAFFLLTGEPEQQDTPAPSEPADEQAEERVETYINEEFGFTFTYPDNNAYILEENPEDASTDPDYQYSVMLTETEEYETFINATEPREDPPTIRMRIYENAEKQSAPVWAVRHPNESNIRLAVAEPEETVVGGANAIRYTADGLYPIDTYMVAHGGFIYLLTSSYLEQNSPIHQDFQVLVDSFTFIPSENILN